MGPLDRVPCGGTQTLTMTMDHIYFLATMSELWKSGLPVQRPLPAGVGAAGCPVNWVATGFHALARPSAVRR